MNRTLLPLDTQNVSLLVVDVQEKLFPHIERNDEILQNCVRLLKAAQTLNFPVLVTEQHPKGIGSTLPQLRELLAPGVPVVEKISFSCCRTDGFADALKALGRPTVLLCGIETHICVLSTAIDLKAAGYNVVLVADACGSRKRDNHDLALAAARALGTYALPTESVVYQLLEKAGTPEFKALLPLFK